jgi:hypothetical protein
LELAAIQSWRRRLDGLVFDSCDLKRLLGMPDLSNKRLLWIRNDFTAWFPVVYPPPRTTVDSPSCVIVCRKEFASPLPDWTLEVEECVAQLRESGVKVEAFATWRSPTFNEGDQLKTYAPS